MKTVPPTLSQFLDHLGQTFRRRPAAHRHAILRAWRDVVEKYERRRRKDALMDVQVSIPTRGVDLTGKVTATFEQDGDVWIGHIPAFRITAQGTSQPHAHRLLAQLCAEYCEVAVEAGRLGDILHAGLRATR